MSSPEERRVDPPRRGWLSSDTLRMVAIAVGFWVAAQLLWSVRSVVIIAFLGILFGILFASATDWLERLKIPRALGATLLVLTVLGAVIWTGVALAPTFQRQFQELRTRIPEAVDDLERRLGISMQALGNGLLEAGAAQAESEQKKGEDETQSAQGEAQPSGGETQSEGGAGPAAGERAGMLRSALTRNAGEIGKILFPVASATASILTGFVILLFVILFYAIAPDFYFRGALHLVPPSRREHAREVLHEVSDALRQWVIARLIAMVVVGIVVAVTLSIIGVRAAILLGTIAFFLELIPFFGPILAAIPAIGMALVDSPQKALIVLVAFLIIEQLEGNLLTPLLLENRADVPPLVTVIAVPAFALVLGLIGALIAEPVMAAVQVLVRKLWVEDHVGETIEET